MGAIEEVGASATAASKEEAELLARLQAQFGDMNVGDMLQGSVDVNCTNSDEESSLEEPTAEELRAWQEAQYEKGRMKLEAKNIMEGESNCSVHKSAVQRRRQKKTAQERTLMREYEENEESNEWEHVAPAPDLGGTSSIFFPTALESDDDGGSGGLELVGGVNPLLQKLVSGDPGVLGTKWHRLYSSSDGDGLSFRNLCSKITGYDGPTVMLLGGKPSPSRRVEQSTGNSRVSLGFFTTDSWVEAPDCFGSDNDCFLFSLELEDNDVKFVRTKARAKSSTSNLGARKYIYCHPSSLPPSNRRRKDVQGQTNGLVHGIGVGGTASQPRLHITESLEECRCLCYDQLFDDGDLLLGKCDQSLYYFDVDAIEVWGVGGEEWISDALKAQVKEKEIQVANLRKARTVDKAQFLNGLTSDGKGLFGHRELVEERCDL